jgi:hypothetical protein
MRTLFVCALAASLAGCSCYAPQTGLEGCTSEYACYDRTSLDQTIDQDAALFNPNSETQKSRLAAKTAKPSYAHARKRTQVVLDLSKPPAATAAKVEPAASTQPAETSDAVTTTAALSGPNAASPQSKK